MKNTILYLFLAFLSVNTGAQESDIDTSALVILDRMSSIIGDLESCSFSVETSQDKQDSTFFHPMDGLGLIKEFNHSTVYMVGPDKLMVNSEGDRGHNGYWYNGMELAYYSYDYNYYALLEGEANILEMIHAVHENYDVDFPAADFFNPYFTDDLLAQSDKIKFLGSGIVNGQKCFRIIASGENQSVQLWISNDAQTLPLKMVILSLNESLHPQYELTFSNWSLNPNIPASMFDFVAPPNATSVTMVPK